MRAEWGGGSSSMKARKGLVHVERPIKEFGEPIRLKYSEAVYFVGIWTKQTFGFHD